MHKKCLTAEINTGLIERPIKYTAARIKRKGAKRFFLLLRSPPHHTFPPPSVVVEVPSAKMFCSLLLNIVLDRVGVEEAARNMPYNVSLVASRCSSMIESVMIVDVLCDIQMP